MQEKQVTIGQESFLLAEPFLVLATQNPLEQEGTYPLPEAQVDRFMLKVLIGYGSKEEELHIAQKNIAKIKAEVSQVLDSDDLEKIKEEIESVHMDQEVKKYIIEIIFASRNPK
jgi:MoxR-like ATPase